MLRVSGAESMEKPERAMCSTLSPASASLTVLVVWRVAASPAGKGMAMRIERKGELWSMFQRALGSGRALVVVAMPSYLRGSPFAAASQLA